MTSLTTSIQLLAIYVKNMARRKLEDRNIRKLQKQSNGSTTIALPADLVREFKWKDKQKVVVRKRGSTLVIEDWKKWEYNDDTALTCIYLNICYSVMRVPKWKLWQTKNCVSPPLWGICVSTHIKTDQWSVFIWVDTTRALRTFAGCYTFVST